MNPFNLSGGEAVLATVIVCGTVGVCVWLSATVTVDVVARICAAVEKVAASIASIWNKP